jgi:multidrug efflux pump subunit AcrB
LRNAFQGIIALRQQRGNNEVTVRVRLPAEQRRSEYNIESLLISTPAGTFVPLAEIASIDRGRAYTSITRRDGRRTVTVTADVEPIGNSPIIMNSLSKDALPELAATFPGLSYGFQGREADRKESVASLLQGFLLALACIYFLLAIPFRSYLQPAIVMVAIPFGMVGAVLGHLLMGYDLSLMSMMGVIALSGVVVNDSLVLVDFINTRLRAGLSEFQASVEGAKLRLRAILLTTATTVAGLMPLMFETSFQAKFLIPMAVTLTFGLIFATALTLIIVPSLNMIFFDIRNLFGGGTATPRPQPPTQPREPQFLDDKAPESARPQPKPRPEPAALPRLSET